MTPDTKFLLWGLGILGGAVGAVALLNRTTPSPAPAPSSGGTDKASGPKSPSTYGVTGQGTKNQYVTPYSNVSEVAVTAEADTTLVVQLAGGAVLGSPAVTYTAGGLSAEQAHTASQATLVLTGQPATIVVQWVDILGKSGPAGQTYTTKILVNGGG